MVQENIIVANLSKGLCSQIGYVDYRIDRASKLGNPYDLQDKEQSDHRKEVVVAYKLWFRANLRQQDPSVIINPELVNPGLVLAKKRKNPTVGEFKQELANIINAVLGGDKVRLMCWCSPKLCHGDVVKEYVESYIKR